MIAAPPSVVHTLAEAAAAVPDREALVCGPVRLTYARYAGAVAALAAEMRGLEGERVAIVAPNTADLAIAIMAAMAAGAEAVPLNPMYTVHELRPVLQDAAPARILASAEVAERIRPLVPELRLPEPETIGAGGRDLASLSGDPAAMPLPDGERIGIVQYTGGTTGRPKGVLLAHRPLAVNVAQRDRVVPTRDGERVLVMTPLYHVYATSMGLWLAPNARGTMVLMPRYTPQDALAAIEAERISFFSGSPTIYHTLLAAPEALRTDFASVECAFSGSAALPAATLERWAEMTGSTICEGYGQTEGGPVLACNPRAGPHRAGSVGFALPQTQIEIVDAVTGEGPLPTGEAGEIRVRGPQIMKGYRNRPEETAEALRGGWLHTGDIGALGPDGALEIRDRKKDMVVVSGFNVYPREVEEALLAHPAVAEAAVFGVPDPRKGEALTAHVIADGATPEMLAAHLAERLARYKLPSRIEIVKAIPRTPIGKVDKPALRAAVRAAAG